MSDKKSSFEEFIFSFCRDFIRAHLSGEKLVKLDVVNDGVSERLKVSIVFESGKDGSMVFHKTSEGGLKRIQLSSDHRNISYNWWDPEFFAQ